MSLILLSPRLQPAPTPPPPPPPAPPPQGLIGVTVTNLNTRPIPLPPWLAGLIEDVDPNLVAPGTISEGENLVPEKAPRLATRGGSRIMLTLHDGGGGAELSHINALAPKSTTGAVVIGWSAVTTKHYAFAVTSDMALAGASEALSRTAFPGTWDRASVARPVLAELFEKLYACDATPVYGTRNTLVSIDRSVAPVIAEPSFAFAAGAAQALRPYCLEEYNNVLFIAGYGDEGAGATDDPALVRHSFLGKDPGGAGGFDKDAYNTIGAKGDRVTAMKKGRGLLLMAKANELYRLEGAGRGYPGWQYQVTGISNTQGMGCENPAALEHAEELWFGIGKQGPFMTDGFSVDPLVGPRQKTWKGIDALDSAFVRYHPERRLMLFGVHRTSGAPDATYPWIMLAWDLNRRVWMPDWRIAGSATRFFTIRAIATTTASAPSQPPSAPVTANVTEQGWTPTWANGDATAETEYWEKEDGQAWELTAVADAGATTTGPLTGRKSHFGYTWKVRHRKNGVPTQYTADVVVQTNMAGLVLTVAGTSFHQPSTLTVYVNVSNINEGLVSTILNINGVDEAPTTNVPKGSTQRVFTRDLANPNSGYALKGKCDDVFWPVTPSAYGAGINV